MRRRARVDNNHAEIVEFLRAMGCSVQTLASVGKGCPDLLVGYQGRNLLLEVKAPKGTATSDQLHWNLGWKGQMGIVRTVEDAQLILAYAVLKQAQP